jgi:hypothetical protein
MRKSVSLVLASAFSLTIAATATISVAQADVKVVSKVTTTGANRFGGGGFGGGFRRGGGEEGGQPAPQTVAPSAGQTYTTYFKGRKARRESADGSSVVIYDRDADKIYTLDPKAKTYYAVDYKSVIGAEPAPANSPIRQETKISLREPTAGTAVATVGGVTAREFTVDGSQKMTINTAMFAGRRGGTAGGAQGGTAQGGDNGQDRGRRGGFGGFGGFSTAISGSISLAGAASVLPTELSGAPYDRTLVLPLLDQLQQVGNQIFQPLLTSIARQQSVPLAAKITLQRTIQMTAPANNTGGDAPAAAAPPTIPPTVLTMEVQSIDRTATLDSALFTVPADFKMVDAPQPRGFGGRGGQGWQNRQGQQNGQNGQGGQDGQRGGGRQGRQRYRNGAPANQNPAAL